MLRTYKLDGQRYKAHPGCREGFREDRKAGLIYGPYVETDEEGKRRFLKGPEEASVRWNMCAYCNGGE